MIHSALHVLTLGRQPQSFLDAPWIPPLLTTTPRRWRRAAALAVLGLSPHYYHRRFQQGLTGAAFREAEFARNMATRRAIGERILLPILKQTDTVLDFGCGPGFMSRFVADHVRHVYAVDISRGALACGRILNGTPNTTFLRGLDGIPEPVDVAYSIAVFQHMTDRAAAAALETLHRSIRPGGTLLAHVVIAALGWRTEDEHRRDRSAAGRLRFRYALNCFSRTEAQTRGLLSAAGFNDIRIRPIADLCPEPVDDICQQHLVTARR